MNKQFSWRNDYAAIFVFLGIVAIGLISNPAPVQSKSTAAQSAGISAVLDSNSRSNDDMFILHESKPLVTRAGAWHTWNDHITLKAGQEKHHVRLIFVNGADGRPKFTDLRVQAARKPFVTLKDFGGADSVSFDLTDRLHAGNTPITVQGFGPSGGRLNWKVYIERPSITSVNPNPISIVDRVSVAGQNFSKDANDVKVLVGSKPAKILTTSETEVQINLPPQAPSGSQDLVVCVKSVKSKPVTVTVRSNPRVTWTDLLSGPPGQSVVISGSGFSPVLSENTVKFGSVQARVVAATESSITCVVPEMRFPNWHVPIVVTTNGMPSKEKRQFNVDVFVVPNQGIPMR